MANRFDKFTERASRALILAQEQAQRFQHSYIDTEHLLLGLVLQRDCVAAKILNNLGVELSMIRSAVEFIVGRGERPPVPEIGLTRPAQKAIELAVEEARRFQHTHIGTEHLLLGLIREREGIAFGVLESLGVSLDSVRTETARVTSQAPPRDAGFRGALANARVAAFVATTNADRARAFYEDVLGLGLIADEQFAVVFVANGTMLRVQKVEALTPHPFTSLGWEVDDIASTMQGLVAKGVAFEHYGLPGQDDTGAWTPPGTSTRVAWFKDPDGNLLSLTQG
jgi:catechol 2,3-dioxygenase-like lactoylglutathione lyase family enzyme